MVADPRETLEAELARLFNLMTEARVSGDYALADMLADAAAKCLMKIAEVPPTPPPVPEPQQPAAQQQQQSQPEEK